jgi:hypothetical protein
VRRRKSLAVRSGAIVSQKEASSGIAAFGLGRLPSARSHCTD